MSHSNEIGDLVKLVVEAGEPNTEIFVIDGLFNLLKQSLGYLETELPPGIYKIKFKAGALIEEVPAVLEPGKETVYISAPVMFFSTPAPIVATRTANQAHLAQARRLSGLVHTRFGQGGKMFVFVRDLEGPARSDPATGLTLHDVNGNLLVDFHETGERNIPEQWAGCSTELKSACYRLRCQTEAFGPMEQTIFVHPGWQTNVFLLRRSFRRQSSSHRRADLSNASILMSPLGELFQPEREEWRTTELVRQGLANRRKVVDQDVLERMDWFESKNAMLGLLVGHLLLLDRKLEHKLLARVVMGLRELIGGHPDVKTLEMRLASSERRADQVDLVFPCPPMLRSSWEMIVRASASNPGLVPERSFSVEIAPYVTGGGAWLVWQLPWRGLKNSFESDDAIDLVELKEALPLIEQRLEEEQTFELLVKSSDLTGLEESLLRYFYRMRKTEVRSKHSILDESQVVKDLQVPYQTARQAAARLISKLNLRVEK